MYIYLEGGELGDMVRLVPPCVALVHLVAEVLEASNVRLDVEEGARHPTLPHLGPSPPKAEMKCVCSFFLTLYSNPISVYYVVGEHSHITSEGGEGCPISTLSEGGRVNFTV